MDERLTAAKVAERRGIRKQTWWALVYRGRAPQPDGVDEFSGLPFWLPTTIDAYEASPDRRRRAG